MDPLKSTVNDSNFKVAVSSLDSLAAMIENAGAALQPFFKAITPSLSEALGNMKQQVQGAASRCLTAMMQEDGAGRVFDRLGGCFKHKNQRVRNQVG